MTKRYTPTVLEGAAHMEIMGAGEWVKWVDYDRARADALREAAQATMIPVKVPNKSKLAALEDQSIWVSGADNHAVRINYAILALTPAPPAEPAQTVQDSFTDLVASAITEAEKAMRKFPQPNYVLLKVAEEAGEVVKACVHFAEGRETRESVEGEMRQTIAMLYRLWVEGDEVNGVRAIAGGKP